MKVRFFNQCISPDGAEQLKKATGKTVMQEFEGAVEEFCSSDHKLYYGDEKLIMETVRCEVSDNKYIKYTLENVFNCSDNVWEMVKEIILESMNTIDGIKPKVLTNDDISLTIRW